MPQFINSPFQKSILLMKGVAAYFIGSFSQQVGNTKLYVTNVALTSNVATVTVQIINGPLPAVGNYISIINSASTTGLFNVNRAVITATTVSNITGAGTISFALTHADVASAPDTGTVFVEPNEIGETVSGNYTSIPVLLQSPDGDSQSTLPLSVVAGAGITAMSATLQVAIKAQTNEWTAVLNLSTGGAVTVVKTGATTYTTGPVIEVPFERGYLYRLAITGVTGSDLVIAKIGG